jgi:hypothetical protein
MSIEEMGVDVYLDATKDIHNGFGAEEIFRMFDAGIMITQIAKLIGTVPGTVRKYKNIWRKQHGNQ